MRRAPSDRARPPGAGTLGLILAACLMQAAGCGGGPPDEPPSPVVSPDSEAAVRAKAQDEAIRKKLEAREAKARRRLPNLPREE